VVAVDIAGNGSADSNEAITQVADDITAPTVLGFKYSSGTELPANPLLSIVASDNYKLAKEALSLIIPQTIILIRLQLNLLLHRNRFQQLFSIYKPEEQAASAAVAL